MRLEPVVFEGDSQTVMHALAGSGKDSDESEFGVIINMCKGLIRAWEGFSFKFVRREMNEVVHKLVRQSRFHVFPPVGHALPEWLINVVQAMCLLAQH